MTKVKIKKTTVESIRNLFKWIDRKGGMGLKAHDKVRSVQQELEEDLKEGR